MIIPAGTTILFTGDSITDCNRDRPVGEGKGLGDGYVALLRSLLWAAFPSRHLRILNTGISGDRVIDIEKRWHQDVTALNPDWLSIMVGINDVWRHFDSPASPLQVDPGLFKQTLSALAEDGIKRFKQVILMTPFFIEPNRKDPMRLMMDQYGSIVKEIAREYKTLFVDTQSSFDQYLSINPSQTLCGDRVHPNSIGHMILARAFLKVVEYQWQGNFT